jgi:carbon-monoxide dehydrogenase medium subunit
MATEANTTSEFHKADSFEEAHALLCDHDAAVIAGGQSLMPLVRQGMVDKELIVDISEIDDHNKIAIDSEALSIGGLTTHQEIVKSDLTGTPWHVLPETAKGIGDRQVRNWGTVGGSIAHSDSSADYPPPMIAMDAEVEYFDGESTERVPFEDFHLDQYTSVLEPADLVTGVRVPRPPAGTGVAFEKSAWRKGWSLVNVASQLTVDGTEITDARICVGAMGPTPLRMEKLEEAMVGQDVNDAEQRQAVAEHVSDFTEPIPEEHASIEYKNRVAERLTEKTLETAAERAQEENA